MDQNVAQELAALALKLIKPRALASGDKHIMVHFLPSEKFSDSFIMGERKGFFGAKPGDPFVRLSINITLRPGVMGDRWVGFTIDIEDPESNPRVSIFREWPESGGEIDGSTSDIPALRTHIAALVETSLTSDGKAAPREAPEGMF